MGPYTPRLVPGQIFAGFRSDCYESFAKTLLSKTHYSVEGTEEHSGAIIIGTPVGEEQKGFEQLTAKYSDYIQWADRRDLELESRWEGLEEIITEIENLRDDPSLGNDVYNTRIENIKNKLSLLQK